MHYLYWHLWRKRVINFMANGKCSVCILFRRPIQFNTNTCICWIYSCRGRANQTIVQMKIYSFFDCEMYPLTTANTRKPVIATTHSHISTKFIWNMITTKRRIRKIFFRIFLWNDHFFFHFIRFARSIAGWLDDVYRCILANK